MRSWTGATAGVRCSASADGTVFLAGILWGSNTDLVTNAVQFIFSPFASIQREIGPLTVSDPLPTGGKKIKKVK